MCRVRKCEDFYNRQQLKVQGYGLTNGKWLFSTVTGKSARGKACGRDEEICFNHEELTEMVTEHCQGDICLCFQFGCKWIGLDQNWICEFQHRQSS